MVRMNLVVDEEVPALLAELAGGERQKGAYLSKMVRDLHAGRIEAEDTNSQEIQRVLIQNLLGRVRTLEGQVSTLLE